MKRRWLLLSTGIVLAAVLAYFLRDLINDKVIVPLSYLWWRIGLYYHSIPENRWWVIVIIVICLMAFASIRPEWSFHYQGLDSQPVQGPVEELMIWIMKLRGNEYYKWLIANRLGKLVRSFLIQREGSDVQHWDGPLNGSAWDPPDEVGAYLKSGLNRPFAKILPSSESLPRPRSAPLDLDPQQVVEYLESQMENRRDGN
jgi:hypothetical protein